MPGTYGRRRRRGGGRRGRRGGRGGSGQDRKTRATCDEHMEYDKRKDAHVEAIAKECSCYCAGLPGSTVVGTNGESIRANTQY